MKFWKAGGKKIKACVARMLRDGVIQTEMQKMETKEAGLQEFNT